MEDRNYKRSCLEPLAFKYSGHLRLSGAVLHMSYHWAWDLYVQEETVVTVSPQICRGEGSGAGWLLHGWLAGSELCWAPDSAFPSHTQWAGSQGPLCLYTQHCRLCRLWAAAVCLVSQLIVRATLTLFFPKGHSRPLMTWVAHSVYFGSFF